MPAAICCACWDHRFPSSVEALVTIAWWNGLAEAERAYRLNVAVRAGACEGSDERVEYFRL